MIRFHQGPLAGDTFREEVLAGLARPRKAIPPKFFYDEEGSRLFEAICRLPEYYPTRTEIGILAECVAEVRGMVGEGCVLIEPGSGSSLKARLLIQGLGPRAYVPMDISQDHLERSARSLAGDFPGLPIHAVAADYTRSLALPELPQGRRLVFFPGSTIGNFEPPDARTFLAHMARWCAPDGGILIGVDLKKAPALLHAAYNDAQGITAAFNLNLLRRINRTLRGDFDVSAFAHYAFYNPPFGRIEMYLVSLRDQEVHVDGRGFSFERGEGLLTEHSYKYTIRSFQALAREAGLEPLRVWQDPEGLFSVHYLRCHQAFHRS